MGKQSQKEATARIRINKLLEESGWRFFDDENGHANIVLEIGTKLTKKRLDEFGNDFEKTANGYLDFLLVDNRQKPLVVLEAKREGKNPLDAKEQARAYAESKRCRFVILSNGRLHYLWDIEQGNPYVISRFPSPETIGVTETAKKDVAALVGEKVGDDYVVLTQMPDYATNAGYRDEKTRPVFIAENNLRFLRPYQIRAIEKLQEQAKKGNERFLFEMATGTGKTLVAAALIKLFLKTGNASKVLFLVDRLELEEQAWKNFTHYLKNDFPYLIIYKEKRNDWQQAEIVVSTVQSLLSDNKYQHLFSPLDFDFIISDEAHRSINGNARALFEYFHGWKLGLTATPKDYLKFVERDRYQRIEPKELERRILLDTYRTFGCPDGNPTYSYSLLDGVKDKYLVNPIVHDTRTEITTELLSEKGYATMVDDGNGGKVEKLFKHRDFEKKFFSDPTNGMLCATFLKHAQRDPLSGEIGKTLVFCVSQAHASKITQLLNEMIDRLYPGKYNSDFAVQVTSNVTDAKQFTINFANNNLLGHTRFIDGYKSSRARVCITVGMMTTGYDCEDILNVVLMRPIFSPSDFIQIKGRGTRTYTFSYKDPFSKKTTEKKKESFYLFDFFASFEYFEEKYDYKQLRKLPPEPTGTGEPGSGEKPTPSGLFENFNFDPLAQMVSTPIGEFGMKVDRMMFGRFEEQMKELIFGRKELPADNIEAIEEYLRVNFFDNPESKITLAGLRDSLGLDRTPTIREIVEKILGSLDRFKSRNELLDEEFFKYITVSKVGDTDLSALRNLFAAYITDAEIRRIIDEGDFTRLVNNPKLTMTELQKIEKDIRRSTIDYIKTYLPQSLVA
ncbi:MAG TPA: DEAD/DEAH box helicase family protein [bacterium]|nr:DEAD/DEAH box helicase family protein [bacterium]